MRTLQIVCVGCLVLATAGACWEERSPAQDGLAGDALLDPYVWLCAGMLHHVVRERPLPDLHLLWGWRAEVLSAEHTGGDTGARHVVSLLYEASTNPATADMPVRNRMTCEFPSNPDWWLSGGRRLVNRVCSEPEVRLLPDRITADGKEIRWDDRQGRAKLEAWADEVKADLCVYGRSNLAPGAAAGLGSTISPWTARNAYQACRPMLEAVAAGKSAAPGCHALNLCANEAPLDDAEMARLYDLIEAAGCRVP